MKDEVREVQFEFTEGCPRGTGVSLRCKGLVIWVEWPPVRGEVINTPCPDSPHYRIRPQSRAAIEERIGCRLTRYQNCVHEHMGRLIE